MPLLKKTEINASLFPGALGRPEGNEGGQTAHTSPNASTILRTEDATAPSSLHDRSAKTSRAPSLLLEGDANEKVILVEFTKDDPENPLNWPAAKKWTMTILLCSMTLCIGLSTTMYSSGIPTMIEELGTSNIAGQAGLTAFNAACAIVPLFVAPLCELAGRRYIYLGAFASFVAISFGIAFAKNIATVLVMRTLSGATGSIGTILVGGTLSDMYTSDDIGLPMSLFSLAAIVSTVTAPSFAGWIDERLGWRWIEYVAIMASGSVLILELIMLRESRGEAILRSRAARLRKETGRSNLRARSELEGETLPQLFRANSLRAIKLLFCEPVVAFLAAWISLAWGVVFAWLSVIGLTFQDVRGWSEGVASLPYLALTLGCAFGFVAGLVQDRLYERAKQRNGGVGVPEARLYFAMGAGLLFGVGIMVFAWTGPFVWVHWFPPCLALTLTALGIYLVFLAVYSYTSDAYPEVASSAIAAQGLCRNILGAVTPLFTRQLFQAIGIQWAGLLFSLLAFCIAPLPFVLYLKGSKIRAASKSATSDEKLVELAEEAKEEREEREGSAAHDKVEVKGAVEAERIA